MAKQRKKIPHRIEAEILFINDRTCCMCRDSSKKVQIHHIDRNPNNNDLSNLVVLCTEHHDEVHKSGGITKGISPTLLRKYKRSWELAVRKQRTPKYGPLKSSSGIEKTLFEFEIRKTAYEILALNDNDVEGISQRLEFLCNIHSLEGYTTQILRSLDQIAIMSGLTSVNKSFLIADKIPILLLNLIDTGPKIVKIKKRDISNLELAIRILGTIGDFSAEYRKSIKVIKSITKTFTTIWDILIDYGLESQALMVLDQLDVISKSCKPIYKDEKPLTSGINEISKLRKKLKTITAEEKPEWERVLTRLNN